MPGGTGQGVATPVTILVGPGGDSTAASLNITLKVKLESLRIEESGTHEQQVADFEILDKTLAYAAMRGEWKVSITHGGSPVFRGFIRQARPEYEAIYGGIAVTAYDVGSLLDKLIIDFPQKFLAGGTDKTRIQSLVNTFGQPLVNEGMTDWSKVQVLNASMPAQSFPVNLTLRQAIERVLGAASDSANYYVDYAVRLHTFDDDNPEATFIAPFDVSVETAPSATEVAPEDLQVEWDSSTVVNWFYVRGKTALGSGICNEQSLGMLTLDGVHYSVDYFGTRKAYLDAPDADTTAKRNRVAKAALRDTRYPIPRVSFSVQEASCQNAAGVRWQAGQLMFVASPIHGLSGRTTDFLNSSLQPLRIVRLTTEYIAGTGTRRMQIEAGGRRRHVFSAGG